MSGGGGVEYFEGTLWSSGLCVRSGLVSHVVLGIIKLKLGQSFDLLKWLLPFFEPL